MRPRGVTTFIEVGPGQVLTGLIRRIAPDALALALDDQAAADRLADPVRRHRRRRRRPRLATAASPLPTQPRLEPANPRRGTPCANPITPAASSSPASASSAPSATTRTPPGTTCSTACPAWAILTKFDTTPLRAQGRGRGHGLRPQGVDGRQGRPPQRAGDVVRRRGRQAGGRGRGPRDHRREPRGHRRRLRHRRRRPDADDRQLARAATRRGPTASRPRSSPTASWTRRRG